MGVGLKEKRSEGQGKWGGSKILKLLPDAYKLDKKLLDSLKWFTLKKFCVFCSKEWQYGHWYILT